LRSVFGQFNQLTLGDLKYNLNDEAKYYRAPNLSYFKIVAANYEKRKDFNWKAEKAMLTN